MSNVNSHALYRKLIARVNLPGNTTRLVNVLGNWGPETEDQFIKLKPEILATLEGMGKVTYTQALQLQQELRRLKAKEKARG